LQECEESLSDRRRTSRTGLEASIACGALTPRLNIGILAVKGSAVRVEGLEGIRMVGPPSESPLKIQRKYSEVPMLGDEDPDLKLPFWKRHLQVLLGLLAGLAAVLVLMLLE
jgi:hypothetical protein